MRRAIALTEDAPIGGINTTPLIDVMLVLLVMFILCIPTATHEVPVPLPQSGPVAEAPPVMHRMAIARDGSVTLDGQAVGADLARRLAAIAAEEDATLSIATDPLARYDRFAQTMAAVRRAGIERLGFVNNAALAGGWDR